MRVNIGPRYKFYFVRHRENIVMLAKGGKDTRRRDIRTCKINGRALNTAQRAKMTELTATEEALGLSLFDACADLLTAEDCQLFLQAALAEDDGDGIYIMRALRLIAESEGMAEIAEKAGFSRSAFYQSLDCTHANGLSFADVLRTIRALGFDLIPAPRMAAPASGHAVSGCADHREEA